MTEAGDKFREEVAAIVSSEKIQSAQKVLLLALTIHTEGLNTYALMEETGIKFCNRRQLHRALDYLLSKGMVRQSFQEQRAGAPYRFYRKAIEMRKQRA